MSLQKTLHGPEGNIIYRCEPHLPEPLHACMLPDYFASCSCSWSPDARMLAAATIAGAIVIFDTESGRELVRYSFHKKVRPATDVR
jgi:hypothetical protein